MACLIESSNLLTLSLEISVDFSSTFCLSFIAIWTWLSNSFHFYGVGFLTWVLEKIDVWLSFKKLLMLIWETDLMLLFMNESMIFSRGIFEYSFLSTSSFFMNIDVKMIEGCSLFSSSWDERTVEVSSDESLSPVPCLFSRIRYFLSMFLYMNLRSGMG